MFKKLLVPLVLLSLIANLYAVNVKDPDGNRIPANLDLITPLELPSAARVLFIGNSFTHYQGGVDTHVGALASADGYPLVVERRAFSGYSWDTHLNGGADPDGNTLADRLAEGWDAVVLQDLSDRPINDLAGHISDADDLVALVRASGGGTTGASEPLFAMTWAYENKDLVMTDTLTEAYTEDGLRNAANVSPLGLAWQRVVDERPDLDLFTDFKHPSLVGQYLNACVHYVVLTGRSVTGNTYIPTGLGVSDAAYLQETADSVVADYSVTPASEEVLVSECIQRMSDLGLKPTTSDTSDPLFAKAYGHYIYFPPSYHGFRYRNYPVLLVSPGKGENGNGEEDLDKVLVHGPASIIAGRDDGLATYVGVHFYDAIIVTPQFNLDNEVAEEFATFIAYLQMRYRIDPNRISMTGLSGGGARTWDFATSLPGQFAAIAPMASAGGTTDGTPFLDADGNLRTRVWAFHNSSDGNSKSPYTVSTNSIRAVASALYPSRTLDDVDPKLNYQHLGSPYDTHSTAIVASATQPGNIFQWNDFTTQPALVDSVGYNVDLSHHKNDLMVTLWDSTGHNAWAKSWRQMVVYDWLFSSAFASSSPFGSQSNVLPLATSVLECENYDNGGSPLAWGDSTPGNSGGAYRSDDVDIAVTGDVSGGFDVVATSPGEYLNYTVRVPTDGDYTLSLRAMSVSGGDVVVDFNGAAISTLTFAAGSWATESSDRFTLPGGEHVFSLRPQTSDLSLNWFQLTLDYVANASIEVIVDNDDLALTTAVGDWVSSVSQPNYYGLDYSYNGTRGRSGQSFTYRPGTSAQLPSGWYEVLARTPAKNDRAVLAVDIYHDGGRDVVPLDMTVSGGVWKSLGVYQMDVANDPRVVIRTDGTTDWCQADAVAFRSAGAPAAPPAGGTPPDISTVEVTVDNLDFLNVRATGFWDVKTNGDGYFGSNYAQVAGGSEYTFSADLPTTGLYEVFIAYPGRSWHGNATVEVEHDSGSQSTLVNQKLGDGGFQSIGVYNFTAGQPAIVSIQTGDAPGGIVVADAVRFQGLDELPPRDLIVDNRDESQTTVSGTWNLSTSKSGYYASDYAWASSNTADHEFCFLPTLDSSGIFKVSIRYTADSGRASNAKATVIHNAGSFDFFVDMRENGGVWNELGTFALDPSVGHGLCLSGEGADSFVIADAVRFEEVDTLPPPPLRDFVVDNLDVAQTVSSGTWNTSRGQGGYYATDYAYAALGDPTQTFSFLPDLAAGGGPFAMSIRFTSDSGRDANVPITITHAGGSYSTTVDMTTDGGTWVPLPAFQLEPGMGHGVTVGTAGTSKFVIADAIRFTELDSLPPPPVELRDLIIDDLDPTQVTVVGNWGTSSSTSGYYGSGYLWHGPGGPGQVDYAPELTSGGVFEVFIRYTSGGSREVNVPVVISHVDGVDTTSVDMSSGGGDWVSLGLYELPAVGGQVSVMVDGATGYTIADAIRLKEVDSETL